MDPFRRGLIALLLVGLLSAPLALAQQRDAPALCDTDRNGRVDDRERAACVERCDGDKDGRISDAERERCAAAAREARAEGDRPPADCRRALEDAHQQRERLQRDIRARWDALKAEQENRTREFGARDHTDEEWARFRAELAAQRERAESRVRNITEELEARVARLQGCAGVAAASRYATCDSQPGDYERFKRLVEREASEFQTTLRARASAALANATTPEERARIEARVESALANQRREMEAKWQELRSAHARSCLREAVGPREVREIQQDVRADRLNCVLQAEGSFDAFFAEAGRDAHNWTDAQRAEFQRLRRAAADLRADCERDVHSGWKAEVKARFDAARRVDRFGSFSIEGDGEGAGTATGRYVAFHYERGSLILNDYAVQGVVVLERFSSPHEILDPRANGATLAVRGADEKTFHARIHDNPTGGFEGRCADPGCTLTFPDGMTRLGEPKANGTSQYRLTIGGTNALLWVHGAHAWSGDATLDVSGAWRLLVPSENFVLDKVGNENRDRIRAAAERGRVLAEVNVVASNGGVAAQTIELADIDATGTAPDVGIEVESNDSGVVVDLSTHAPTGESVVINVDAEALGGNLTADEIQIEYYDVAEDGTLTQIAIVDADSAEDALESDEDAPEAHVVVGEDGVQVIVSNPHFSEKRIVISRTSTGGTTDGGTTGGGDGTTGGATPTPTSGGETPPANDTPAPGALLVGAVIALGALVLRRRRG